MKLQTLFTGKTLLVLMAVLGFLVNPAEAQVPDSTYQKQELNTGMPPASVPQPVIVTPPPPPAAVKKATADTVAKEKVKVKEEDDVPFRKKLFTGGGFGLSFGDYTNIQVSPILGYRLSDRFALGLGLSYFYFSNGFDNATLLGGKAFAQAIVYKEFFAHAEYEQLSGINDFNYDVSALMVGAGYRQMVSERVGFDLMVLMDLNQNSRSLYDNPIFRGGLIINL